MIVLLDVKTILYLESDDRFSIFAIRSRGAIFRKTNRESQISIAHQNYFTVKVTTTGAKAKPSSLTNPDAL